MAIPVEFTKTADELLVAEILASWSIEDVRRGHNADADALVNQALDNA